MIIKAPASAVALVIAMMATGCGQPPVSDEPQQAEVPSAGDSAPTLSTIMQALAADMAESAGGIWVEDVAIVAEAARRIADHPPVSPEERAVIQAALGPDFGNFVSFDQGVHSAAAELATGAANGREIPDLMDQYVLIQEGCVGCHEAFRADVSAALTALGAVGR